MKAIILAAGSGSRLAHLTDNLPKCMLNFNGKPLIEWQVAALRDCGIDDIVIVKGYMEHKINIPNVKYYTNKEYATTNMVESLFTAEDELDGELLICYADILFESNVIRQILGSKTDIGVTVDADYWEYWQARLDVPEDDIESLVIDEGGKIAEIGIPDCPRSKAQHRYVGLIRFSEAGTQKLKEVYHENKDKYYDKDEPWLGSKTFKTGYMTSLLQALINSGSRVDPIVISRGWLEFDNVEDYERASKWKDEDTLNRFIHLPR